jgi:glycosyltransferase involved in cell wall biosynthesis
MVVTECAAAGTACVGYRVPGVADSIRHGETGDLVQVRDVDALAAATLSLYRDREKLERYRRAGIAWASRFRWEESRRLFFETVTKERLTPNV